MKKFLYVVSLLFSLGVLYAQQMPMQAVKVGLVTTANDIIVRKYIGRLETAEKVTLLTRVSGDLLEVGFKDGDFVKKGQLLYTIDDIRYQANVKSIEAQIAQAKAQLYYSERNYDRTKKLFEKEVDTQDTLDSIYSALKVSEAQLQNAEASLILAKDDLKHTKIIAPISGKIGVTNYTVGNYLTPASGVLSTIMSMDPMRLAFSMSNRDFVKFFNNEESLKKMAEVRITLADGSDYPQMGKVSFINNEVGKRTDTVKIYADFKNSEFKLLPGSTMTVSVFIDKKQQVPAIIPTALMRSNTGAYVYVVNSDNKVSMRSVTPGTQYQGLYRIEKGLSVGEMVITDGMHKIQAGATIIPVMEKGK
ncbi:MAG: efflux RND transporter periplasmic adaptor subunit [Lentisphaeria bacterium]